MIFSILWKGILLGLGAAAPIGPVNVEIARRSLRGGFRAGFLLGCGAVTVDVCYAILTSLGFRSITNYPKIMLVLGVAGSLVLTYLGFLCFRSAIKQLRNGLPKDGNSQPPKRNYLTGLIMTSLNPMTLAFWLVVVPGLSGRISSRPAYDLPFLCAGVFLGAFCWVIFFTSITTLAGQIARKTTALLADVAGGVLLLGFAVYAFCHLF